MSSMSLALLAWRKRTAAHVRAMVNTRMVVERRPLAAAYDNQSGMRAASPREDHSVRDRG